MESVIKNGHEISAITLGTVQLGIPYGINNSYGKPSYEQAKEILDTALNNGIVTFDTAKGYGESEAVLGRYFAENPVKKTIITKVEFDTEPLEEVKESLFTKVKDSAKVMDLDKVPEVLLHSETYLDNYGDVLVQAVKELKAEGLTDRVGISFSDRSKLMQYTDPTVFDSVQIPMNMFDSEEIRNGNVKKLEQMGISVYVRSIYLQGLFFKDTDALPEKIKCAKTPLDKIKKLAADSGISVAALALAYMRDAEGITSLVMGCDTPQQLLETVNLYETAKINKKVMDKVAEIAEEVEPIVIRPWEWNK